MPHRDKYACIIKSQWLAWFYIFSKCKICVYIDTICKYSVHINVCLCSLQAGGFRLPFISMGALLILVGILSVFMLPKQDGKFYLVHPIAVNRK